MSGSSIYSGSTYSGSREMHGVRYVTKHNTGFAFHPEYRSEGLSVQRVEPYDGPSLYTEYGERVPRGVQVWLNTTDDLGRIQQYPFHVTPSPNTGSTLGRRGIQTNPTRSITPQEFDPFPRDTGVSIHMAGYKKYPSTPEHERTTYVRKTTAFEQERPTYFRKTTEWNDWTWDSRERRYWCSRWKDGEKEYKYGHC